MGYIAQEILPVFFHLFQLLDLFGLVACPYLHLPVKVGGDIFRIDLSPQLLLRKGDIMDGFKYGVDLLFHESAEKVAYREKCNKEKESSDDQILRIEVGYPCEVKDENPCPVHSSDDKSNQQRL